MFDANAVFTPETLSSIDGLQTQRPAEVLLWRVQDLARAIGCDRRTIERLEASGKLGPRRLKLGGMVRYEATECRAWVSAGCPARDEWTWAAHGQEIRRGRAKNGEK
jgi:hypothetical protein